MTRFARGCETNKKKPHEPTTWGKMVEDAGSSKVPSSQRQLKSSRKIKKKESEISMKAKRLHKKAPLSKSYKVERHSRTQSTIRNSDASYHLVNKHKSDDDNIIIRRPEPEKPKGLASELEELMVNHAGDEAQEELASFIKKDHRREQRRLKRVEERTMAKVCFNCRETGHDMASCPRLSVSQGMGICFKCGSTEHALSKCKLKLPQGVFPYAKCFICGEQGHLSKQCPDNPKGLYPNGGCCKLCGSVEHYKKDCPTHQQRQGIGEVKLQKWTNMDSVDAELWGSEPHKPKKKTPKIVTF